MFSADSCRHIHSGGTSISRYPLAPWRRSRSNTRFGDWCFMLLSGDGSYRNTVLLTRLSSRTIDNLFIIGLLTIVWHSLRHINARLTGPMAHSDRYCGSAATWLATQFCCPESKSLEMWLRKKQQDSYPCQWSSSWPWLATMVPRSLLGEVPSEYGDCEYHCSYNVAGTNKCKS